MFQVVDYPQYHLRWLCSPTVHGLVHSSNISEHPKMVSACQFQVESKALVLSFLPSHSNLSPGDKWTPKERCQRKPPIPWLMKATLCMESGQCHELQNAADVSTSWFPAVAFQCNHPEEGTERLQNDHSSAHWPQNHVAGTQRDKGGIPPSNWTC